MSSRIRKAKFNNIKRLNQSILGEQTKPNMGIENLHPGRPPKKPSKPATSKAGYDCKAIGDIGTVCVPHGLPNEEAYQAYGVYSPYSGWGNWQNPSPMYPTYDACMNSIPSDSWAYNNDGWECAPIYEPQKPDNSDPTSDANPDGTSTDPWTYHYNNIDNNGQYNLGMPNFGCLDPAAWNYAYWDHVTGDCGLPVTDIDDIPEGSYGSTSCCIYGDWSYQDWLDGQSSRSKKTLKEGCGCGEAKETSEDSYMAASQLHSIANKAQNMYDNLEKDEVLEDWVESHLAKIDQMMDSVVDAQIFDDAKKEDGDIGAGGCPPGQHWCAESGMCRNDNPPQMEPLTLMGADVVALQERIGKKVSKGMSSSKRRPDMECHPNSGCWNCRPGNVEFGDVCVPWNGVGTPQYSSLHHCVSSGCNIGNNQIDQSFP